MWTSVGVRAPDVLQDPVGHLAVRDRALDHLDELLVGQAGRLEPGAIEALPEKGGEIEVTVRSARPFVEIRIKDNGTGIPREKIGKIFTPFFTTKEVGKGTGQGLAICHDVIVEKHGGAITFETEVGQGTTFTVLLPVKGAQPQALAA